MSDQLHNMHVAGSSYHAVVMDFGSCQEAHIEVQNRTEALAVQEDAEVTYLLVHVLTACIRQHNL